MNLIATSAPWLFAVGGLAWAIISYSHNHRRTLALERTKFIFEQSKFFETDPSMQTANKILYGLTPGFTIESFLNVMKSHNGTPDEILMCMAIENYLNFLWRIAYAHLTLKTITAEDLDAFGYYLYKISLHVGLSDYCMKEGFEEIIEVVKKLEPIGENAKVRNSSYLSFSQGRPPAATVPDNC